MEAEISEQVGAEKSERADRRSDYRCGYRPRRLDTRMGTMYLMEYAEDWSFSRAYLSENSIQVLLQAVA
jgi:hypothetical protein